MNSLVGNPIRAGLGLDSGDLTPLSIPGTPAPGPVLGLPGPKSSGSGRVSRQSDFASERISAGSNPLSHSTSSATDHVIERCAIRSIAPEEI